MNSNPAPVASVVTPRGAATASSPLARILAARVRLLEFALTHTLEELLVATLDEAEALTGSVVGFYHFLEADQQTLSLQAWSTQTTREFCQAEGKGRHYAVAEAGVWVDCLRQRQAVIHNDYSALPHRRGLPTGHAQITRELVVPVFRGDLIVALLGVGNKPTDYDTADREAVTALADLAWDIAERKRAEEALRISEQRFRRAFEDGPVGMALVGEDFRFQRVNAAFSRWLGYAPEELVSRSVLDVTHPEHAEQDRASIQQLLSGELPVYRTEKRYLCRDGAVVWGALTVSVVRNSRGRLLHLLALVEDITARRMAEAQNRQLLTDIQIEQQKLAAVVNGMADEVWFADAAGRFTLFNAAARTAFQLDPAHPVKVEELANRLEVLRPDGSPRPLAEAPPLRALAGQTVTQQEELVRLPGQREWRHRQVSANPVRAADGEVVGAIAVVRDITEAKRAEQTIREIAAYNRSLIEASLDPQVTIGADGRIMDVNHATELATGYPREVLVGQDFSDYFTDPALARAGYQRVFREGAVRDYPLYLLHREGGVMPVLYNASVYRDASGREMGVFAAARDITDRKRAEESRLELERRLHQAQKAESLARMAGAVAHNFNNQLQAVLGNLELSLYSLPPGSKVAEYLNESTRAARNAAKISSLMLTYLGQTPSQQESLDLGELCRSCLATLRPSLPPGVELVADLCTPSPTLRASPHQLQQILTHLATNAWESLGNKPGVIRFSLRVVPPEAIGRAHRFPHDWQPQAGPYACLAIADNGAGIPAADLEKVFDPFFSTKFAGRGLGLPVVLGLARVHGGAVSVTSEVGQGSVFRVFLPVTDVPAPTRPAPKSAAVAPAKASGTVLVVDDEEPGRKLSRIVLKHLGYDVLDAPGGREAVALLRQHRDTIACVLCDLTMPGMDGWETLTALREVVPDLPIILTSGYDQAEVMAGQHDELPSAFLPKPFQMPALREALRQALATRPAPSAHAH